MIHPGSCSGQAGPTRPTSPRAVAVSSPALSSQKKGVQGLHHNIPVPALSLGKAVGGRAKSDSAPVDKGTHLTLFKGDPLGFSSRWLSPERIQPHRSPGQVSSSPRAPAGSWGRAPLNSYPRPTAGLLSCCMRAPHSLLLLSLLLRLFSPSPTRPSGSTCPCC